MTKPYKVQYSQMMAQEQELHMVEDCSCFNPFMLVVIILSIMARFAVSLKHSIKSVFTRSQRDN